MWRLYILLCAFYGNYVYLCLSIPMKKFLFSVNACVFITMMLFMIKNEVFI